MSYLILEGNSPSLEPLVHVCVVFGNSFGLDVHSTDVLRLHLPDDLADVILCGLEDCDK